MHACGGGKECLMGDSALNRANACDEISLCCPAAFEKLKKEAEAEDAQKAALWADVRPHLFPLRMTCILAVQAPCKSCMHASRLVRSSRSVPVHSSTQEGGLRMQWAAVR
jgi:hypothetical protein